MSEHEASTSELDSMRAWEIIRSWKDPQFREELLRRKQTLPPHPAGLIKILELQFAEARSSQTCTAGCGGTKYCGSWGNCDPESIACTVGTDCGR